MMKMLALVLSLAGPAAAMPDPAQISLLPGWRTADGSHMAGLRVDLAPGWKTYWRSPGDAGIPPVFDLTGSHNVSGMIVHWPAPEVFHQDGMRIVAYKGDVVLPVELQMTDPARPVDVTLSLDLGVCKDICMPLNVSFSAELPPSKRRDPRIVAALLDQPLRGPGRMRCDIAPFKGGLSLTARMPFPNAAEAVVELNQPGVWVSEPETTRTPSGLSATAELVGEAIVLDRSQVRVTLLPPGGGAVEYVGCD